jgi:hypothetical protein
VVRKTSRIIYRYMPHITKILGLVAVAGLAVVLLYPQAKPALGAKEAEWKDRIERAGARAAYEALADEYASRPPEEQHTAAHYFGAALFAAEGTKGIEVCDERFNYGCYHQLLGSAIAAEGLAVVPVLNDVCRTTTKEERSPLVCQHGIGHGIAAYLGYAREDFLKALGVCSTLPDIDPIGGCYGGAFMEYNFQTMLGAEGRVRAAGDDALELCTSVTDAYLLACAYWQPQWWSQVLMSRGMDEDEAFGTMGTWCQSLGGGARLACFEGMGNITPPAAQFNEERSIALCQAASADLRERTHCLAAAAGSLAQGGSGATGNGRVLCEVLSGREREWCLRFAHIEQGSLPPL